jgi:hypothetical protein
VALVWSYDAAAEPGEAGGVDGGAGAGAPTRTRLRVRTSVSVDPSHPAAEVRAALCRQVARRAPADLERLRALIERYEAGKPRARAATGALVGERVAPPGTVQ